MFQAVNFTLRKPVSTQNVLHSMSTRCNDRKNNFFPLALIFVGFQNLLLFTPGQKGTCVKIQRNKQKKTCSKNWTSNQPYEWFIAWSWGKLKIVFSYEVTKRGFHPYLLFEENFCFRKERGKRKVIPTKTLFHSIVFSTSWLKPCLERTLNEDFFWLPFLLCRALQ